MSTDLVQVDSNRVVVALGRFQLGLHENEELMRVIGASQLRSVRKTFREQGSPAGSWAPLSPATIRRDPKKYGAGHKLLIDKGRLLNSITFAPFQGGVTIGTNLVYARVQQQGSADRSGGSIGPQARIKGRSVTVKQHRRGNTRRRLGAVPVYGEGPQQRAFTSGPLGQQTVKTHERFQNIPARPYLVIRPEDPERIRGLVVAYVNTRRREAGLGGA